MCGVCPFPNTCRQSRCRPFDKSRRRTRVELRSGLFDGFMRRSLSPASDHSHGPKHGCCRDLNCFSFLIRNHSNSNIVQSDLPATELTVQLFFFLLPPFLCTERGRAVPPLCAPPSPQSLRDGGLVSSFQRRVDLSPLSHSRRTNTAPTFRLTMRLSRPRPSLHARFN